MGHITEKISLGAIEFGERFGALAFVLISSRLRNRRCDLSRRQFEERSILTVETLLRVDAGNQESINGRYQAIEQNRSQHTIKMIIAFFTYIVVADIGCENFHRVKAVDDEQYN